MAPSAMAPPAMAPSAMWLLQLCGCIALLARPWRIRDWKSWNWIVEIEQSAKLNMKLENEWGRELSLDTKDTVRQLFMRYVFKVELLRSLAAAVRIEVERAENEQLRSSSRRGWMCSQRLSLDTRLTVRKVPVSHVSVNESWRSWMWKRIRNWMNQWIIFWYKNDSDETVYDECIEK